jgi:hypothetical protein
MRNNLQNLTILPDGGEAKIKLTTRSGKELERVVDIQATGGFFETSEPEDLFEEMLIVSGNFRFLIEPKLTPQ